MALYQEELEAISQPNNFYEAEILKQFPQYRNINDIKINEQDSSRLSRGVSTGTIVEVKDNTRELEIPIALSLDKWDQPPSAFNASYPNNLVLETRNGLIQEFDDTEGSERYHLYHPSGTFMEWDSEGNSVRKTIGDTYEIIEKNGMIYVKGSCNITIGGACNIFVMNDCNLEVNGSLNGMIKNDINLTTNGCMNLNVKETFKIRADNMVMETSKFTHKNVGRYTTSTNTKDEIVTENYALKTGLYSLNSESDIVLDGSGKISGKTNMHLENNLYVKDEIHVPLLKGTAQRAQYSDGANKSNSSTIASSLSGTTPPTVVEPDPTTPELSSSLTPDTAMATGLMIPGDRTSISMPEISRGIPNTRLTRIAIENDGKDAPTSFALYPEYNKSPPYVDPNDNDLVDDNSEMGRAIPSSFGATYRKSIIPITNVITTSFPSTQISKYFILADVSTRAAFPHTIRTQNGLTDVEIAQNLQQLATNILDKIVDEYGRPSFVITSGFRPYNGQGNPSQHELGQAVDIQFKINIDDYKKRAEELIKILTFDQFLLEYQSGGTGKPWFHISFNINKMRNEYATFYNHRAVTPFSRA